MIRPTARPAAATRAAALLALGALVVHELRYVLAYGGEAQRVMASEGHGYLGELAPALVVFALSAICGRLAAAALGGRGASAARRPVLRSTAAFAAALGAIFAGQELIEGAMYAGHPGGLAAIFGAGGWIAVPLALLCGLLAALADRALAGAEDALVRRAARGRRGLPRPSPARGRRPGRGFRLPQASPLAFGLARRPPPVPLVP